ncbi:class A sortase [Liquorilactobacillus capillatus]|uniref:Sortase n=1 Tax=Liquorilactobacillus capillatus DSM 19910 TaxID=1423731 RepID=A0A0R1LYV7_9LACO|nr:class A sortase [Liquorilactobacillus capillatus]KRL00593.1 sortase [Liquorilactobacillus capillatus DSM 19910]
MDKKRVALVKLVLLVVLMAVGIILIFNEQIKNMVITNMTQTAVEHKIQSISKINKKKTSFNFKKVKPAGISAVKNAWKDDTQAIGMLAIPTVKLKLAIFYGLSNENLLRGTGTMKAAEKMGQGNYALAGHHMNNPKVLFSPLAKVKNGTMIYLTDGKQAYEYRVIMKKVVDEYQVQWIDDVPEKKLVTLVTCLTAQAGENRRIIVQGELLKSIPLNKTKAFD